MRRVMVATVIGVATSVCALGAAAPAADDQVGRVALRYSAADAELGGGARAERRWLIAEGCVAGPVAPAERAALKRSLARVREMLADPALRRLIAQKSDWAVPGASEGERPGAVWVIDPRAGARALARLDGDRGPTLLDVLTYDGGPLCAVGLTGDATNAYSVPERAVLLLRRPYLRAQLGLGSDGERRLAATLLHEILHDVGFAHPRPDDGLDTPAYLSSVPIYLGCAARLWPDLDAIRRGCGVVAAAAVPAR